MGRMSLLFLEIHAGHRFVEQDQSRLSAGGAQPTRLRKRRGACRRWFAHRLRSRKSMISSTLRRCSSSCCAPVTSTDPVTIPSGDAARP